MKTTLCRTLTFTYAFLALAGCNESDQQQVQPESAGITNPVPIVPGAPTPTPYPTATPVPTATPSPTPSGATPSLSISLGIKPSVDLRAYDGPIMEQFGGTCSAFATAAAMNNRLKQKGINKLVSERHLWDTYGIYDMDEAIDAASSHYLTEEKYWPSESASPKSTYMDYAALKITQYKSWQYNMNAALQALNKNHPVVMAIQVPSDLSYCEEWIDPNSAYTSGEHVMEAVGYQLDDSVSGGGYFILKNSWGTGCGNKGYHQYPFALCKRSDLYCYFTEIVDVESRN